MIQHDNANGFNKFNKFIQTYKANRKWKKAEMKKKLAPEMK